MILISLIVPNFGDTVDGDMSLYSCEEVGTHCYGGYDKPDQDCIKKKDCDSVLTSSKNGSYNIWNLFLLVHIKPTTDQLIFSRQPSHVTSRDAIIFETDNPKTERLPCVYVTLDGRHSDCSRNFSYQVFKILPDKGSYLIGPNGTTQYVGYQLVSTDWLTYPITCPKVYFVVPTLEKTSITIRRLQYDDKTVVSEVNFDFIDVFGLGLKDGPTKRKPYCYEPPNAQTIATKATTPTTATRHSSKPGRSLQTQAGGATRPRMRKSLLVAVMLALMAVCAILAVGLYVDFVLKGKIKDGTTFSKRDYVSTFTSETQAQ
ncbi:hypothetical protein HDE_01995 [Halotydeus destructor]|nr:hypothetical protein HDE_01995 [Halotydeus destructor]